MDGSLKNGDAVAEDLRVALPDSVAGNVSPAGERLLPPRPMYRSRSRHNAPEGGDFGGKKGMKESHCVVRV